VSEYRIEAEATVTALVQLGPGHALYASEQAKLVQLRDRLAADARYWQSHAHGHRNGVLEDHQDASDDAQARAVHARLSEVLAYIDQAAAALLAPSKTDVSLAAEAAREAEAVAAAVYAMMDEVPRLDTPSDAEAAQDALQRHTRQLAALRKRIEAALPREREAAAAAELRRTVLLVEELQGVVAELRFAVQQRLTSARSIARTVDECDSPPSPLPPRPPPGLSRAHLVAIRSSLRQEGTTRSNVRAEEQLFDL